MEDTKLKLSTLWIAHFLMWTFGDMLSLLQETTESAPDELLLFVAAPLAVIQTFLILFSLMGNYKFNRLVNMGGAVLFLVFNIGYIGDALTAQNPGWAYVLGVAYIAYNLLVIVIAWKWTPEN